MEFWVFAILAALVGFGWRSHTTIDCRNCQNLLMYNQLESRFFFLFSSLLHQVGVSPERERASRFGRNNDVQTGFVEDFVQLERSRAARRCSSKLFLSIFDHLVDGFDFQEERKKREKTKQQRRETEAAMDTDESAYLQQRQFLDFDDLIFQQGSHFMSSKKCQLPDGSSRTQRKGKLGVGFSMGLWSDRDYRKRQFRKRHFVTIRWFFRL